MSDFAEWRPCSICGLPVALPKRVHTVCAANEPRCQSCGSRLTIEEAEDGTHCSACMWADELAFLEEAYSADVYDRGESPDAPQEATQERQPGYGWAGIFM